MFDTWLLRCRLPPVRAGCASFYVYFPTANPSSHLTQKRSSQTSHEDAEVPANLKVHAFWWERTPPRAEQKQSLFLFLIFYPPSIIDRGKRKERRGPLIQAGCLHILQASPAVHPWVIWSKSDQEHQFICLSRLSCSHSPTNSSKHQW